MSMLPLFDNVPVQYISNPFGPPYPFGLLHAVNVTFELMVKFPFTFSITIFFAYSFAVATS